MTLARKENHVNHEELIGDLRYDPDEGVFTWIKPRSGIRVGARAGCESKGYRYLRYNGRNHMEHRLAWFYVHKEWPEVVMHGLGGSLDNRICNLSAGTHALNSRDCAALSNNTSGITGVRKDDYTRNPDGTRRVYWRAQCPNGLGGKTSKTFPYTEQGKQDAIAWRAERLKELGGYTERHGLPRIPTNSVGGPTLEKEASQQK